MASLRADKELETIGYIKRLAEALQASQELSSDSLALSDSQPSQATLRRPRSKESRGELASDYVSPYRQAGLSIGRIEKSGRPRLGPISFSNTLLQLATSREREEGRPASGNPSPSPSRYRNGPSLLEKLEGSDLDRLRLEAREMHALQERQRKQMTPRQKDEKWADFLLRERKWEAERVAREARERQRQLEGQRRDSAYTPTGPRGAPGLSRQNLIRKIKRQRLKLQEQLEASSRGPRWRSAREGARGRVVCDPREAAFLVE